jgi:glycosyltransferase involved in cell wall biosynthesis
VPESVWLVIAGVKGQSRIFKNAEIGALPSRVIMSGFISEDSLPALYSGASALLYPSIYEGFGLPALEAMACGTVPIVSKGTAMSEVVDDYGILINPLEVDSIAIGISRSITDLSMRDRLSHAGRQRSKTFSWERSAELTHKALVGAIEQEVRTTRQAPTYFDFSGMHRRT